jgi:hypothetical protein
MVHALISASECLRGKIREIINTYKHEKRYAGEFDLEADPPFPLQGIKSLRVANLEQLHAQMVGLPSMDWRAVDGRIRKKVFASHTLQAFVQKRMNEQPSPAFGENVLQLQGRPMATLATADDAPAAATRGVHISWHIRYIHELAMYDAVYKQMNRSTSTGKSCATRCC